MTKLSYDDGVVRSTVVEIDSGVLMEVRRGDLTGKALKAAKHGQRRWSEFACWLEDVCEEAGVERKVWAVLGTYTFRWTNIKSTDQLLKHLRYLQRMHNASQSVGARLYWAICIAEISGAGFKWNSIPILIKKPFIIAHPEIALEIVKICDCINRILRRSKRRQGWFPQHLAALDNLHLSGYMENPDVLAWRAEYNGGGPVSIADLPDIDMFHTIDTLATIDKELAFARADVAALEERRIALLYPTA